MTEIQQSSRGMEKEKYRWEGGRGVIIMKNAIIALVLTVFLSSLGHAQTLIYSWRDRAGTVHVVDDINRVPLQYREGMKIYRISSTKGTEGPRHKASSKPVMREKALEQGTVKGRELEEEIGEVRGSITELRESLDRLRQERETKRIRMIRKRARGKTVVREKGEIENIDGEIETLTNQLGKRMEALRSLEQEQLPKGGQ